MSIRLLKQTFSKYNAAAHPSVIVMPQSAFYGQKRDNVTYVQLSRVFSAVQEGAEVVVLRDRSCIEDGLEYQQLTPNGDVIVPRLMIAGHFGPMRAPLDDQHTFDLDAHAYDKDNEIIRRGSPNLNKIFGITELYAPHHFKVSRNRRAIQVAHTLPNGYALHATLMADNNYMFALQAK